MASDTLDDTEEKCNGTKIARLLVDGGTKTLRRLFDSIHSPANLQAALHTHRVVLTNLRKIRVLNSSQCDKLYPPTGAAPDSKTFDITLLFLLLRNICGLTAPAAGWDTLPHAADASQSANLARIKYFRNQVYGHVTGTGVSKADFEQYWSNISGALVALGADQVSIDLLKSSPIGSTEYFNLLQEWKREEEDLKQIVDERFRKVEEKLTEALKRDPLHKSLRECEFAGHVRFLADHYQEGTRQRLLTGIEEFLTSSSTHSKAMVITAVPGVGKSVLAAVACMNLREKGCLGACHFLQHNNSQRSNPSVVVESIARQLCESVEGFIEKLDDQLVSLQPDIRKKLDEMNLETLISFLLEEPLNKVPRSSAVNNIVVIIDALDECEHSTRDEFAKSLKRKLPSMPCWIKFVLTTRPTKHWAVELLHVTVVNIDATDSESMKDVSYYLSNKLQSLYVKESSELLKNIVEKLTNKSSGIFLFAYFAVESAKKRGLSLNELSHIFPNGLSSVYEEYITRAQKELNIDEERFRNFLEAMVAAFAPLPGPMVLEILGLKQVSWQDKKEARLALEAISLLFPTQNNYISIFHTSLADWLTATKGHDFTVSVNDGHHVLAQRCFENLRVAKINNYKNFPFETRECDKYPLEFGFVHMLAVKDGSYEKRLVECVLDLELLTAFYVHIRSSIFLQVFLSRICAISSTHSEELKQLLLSFILLKTAALNIPVYPQFILQCAAICPAKTRIKSQAVEILSSPKYRECVWMEEHRLLTNKNPRNVKSLCSSEHTTAILLWNSSGDYTLITLRIADRKLFAFVKLKCVKHETSIDISQNGVHVLVNRGNQLEVRDVQALTVQKIFQLKDDDSKDLLATSCCFLQIGKIAAGCDDGRVRVCDVESGSVEAVLSNPFGPAAYCVASPTGQLLTVEEDSAVLWKSLQPPVPVKLTSHLKNQGNTVCFSPNGKIVACWCEVLPGVDKLGVVKVFDSEREQLQRSIPIYSRRSHFYCLTFLDDCHVLLSGIWICKESQVVNVDSCSIQEIVVPYLHICRTKVKECVATDSEFGRNKTVSKLTFHNLN